MDASALRLRTNLRYIWPLFRHVLSLDPAYPLGVLYFVDLPIYTANAFCGTAQAPFVAHTLGEPSLLDLREGRHAAASGGGEVLSRPGSLSPRAALLANLSAQEDNLRTAGLDPALSDTGWLALVAHACTRMRWCDIYSCAGS
jgi:hypothetical protein